MRDFTPTDVGSPMSERTTIQAILDDNSAGHLEVLPKHIRRDCECRIVEAPKGEIGAIIKNGGVPILNLQPNGTDKLGLIAKPFDGSTKYAVVWHRPDDKFASARYNTITTCQLIRLADRLGALHLREGGVEICFWMQSLCIPFDSNSQVDNGSQLLSQKDTFSKAYAVLIMDSHWLAQPSPVSDEKPYKEVNKLRLDFPDLMLSKRLLLIGPSGFHIEVENATSPVGHAEREDVEQREL